MLIMKNRQLLIKKIEAKQVENEIIYTQDQGMQSFEGEILATCDEKEYPVGAIVIFYEKAGEPVLIDRQKFLMLDSENVWCLKVEDKCK